MSVSYLEAILNAGSPGPLILLLFGPLAMKIHKLLKIT